MGSGAVIVIDENTDMVKLLWRITKFYAHESCGQCTPCREGCQWMEGILHKLMTGQGQERDIDLLVDLATNIGGKTLCALGDAAAGPVISFIKKFRPEFEAYARGQKKHA